MVELPNATGQTGETAPGDLLHLRQGILLDHSGMGGASSRIIFESSGLRKQVSRPFFGFWFLHSGLLSHWFSCLAQFYLRGRG